MIISHLVSIKSGLKTAEPKHQRHSNLSNLSFFLHLFSFKTLPVLFFCRQEGAAIVAGCTGDHTEISEVEEEEEKPRRLSVEPPETTAADRTAREE